MAKCCICDDPTSGSFEFCRKHFETYREEIAEKKPWVKALKNEAQRERRKRDKESLTTSLDAILEYQNTNRRYYD
jgi:hypothetical protein